MIRTKKESLAIKIKNARTPDINMAWKWASAIAEEYGCAVYNQRTVNTYGYPDLERLKADIEAKLDAGFTTACPICGMEH